MSDRTKMTLGLAASMLLHLLGILGLMEWASLRSDAKSTTPPADLSQIVVTVEPQPKKPEPVLKEAAQATPEPKSMEIDSSGLAKADSTPDHPLFESDINSRAASRLAPSGLMPLPSQEGKDRPFPKFETKKYSPGPTQQPPEMEMPPAAASAVQQAASEPAPQLARPAVAQTSPDMVPKPTPVAQPKPAPTVAKVKPLPSPTPDESMLAMRMEATPTPVPTPEETPTPNPDEIPRPTPVQSANKAPQTNPAALPKPVPRRPRRPSYQPDTEETRVQGSISNLGPRSGADMVSTPLGRYRKTIADAIGSRWYFYINQKMDLITVGSVHIKFYIDQAGHVEDIKILSNSANGAFGDFSVESITEAELPPLPPDLAPKLENGRLEVEYTFTIYPN